MSKQWIIICSIIVSLPLSACMTLMSQTLDADEDCRDLTPLPNIYSGVTMDIRGIGHYGCDTKGRCEYGHHKGTNNFEFFLILDIPLSLALDTVLLPVTVYKQLKYGNICKYMSGIEKELYSSSLSREQLVEIKNILEANGYKKIWKDDYLYKGAFETQYSKEIKTQPEIKYSQVQIVMSFKTVDLSTGKLMNYGFSVFHLRHDNVKEINDEIGRIESIIYGKLIEFAGADNVVRGPR